LGRQKNYIPTLDGWRALSVAGVVLYHGRFGFFGSHHLPVSLAAHGYLGVDVFFAISGFLICSILLQEFALTGDIDLRRFYMRRFFRILPAYYVAFAAIFLLGLFHVIRENYIDVPSCLLFYRNFMPLGADWHGGFYTAHFWSLSIEEQFYLLWPIVLLALKPKQAGKVAVVLSVFAYCWKVTLGHFPALSDVVPPAMGMLARTDTLLWGCLAALYFTEIRRWVQQSRFTQLWLPILLMLLVGQASRVPELVSLSSILLPALVLSTALQPQSLLSRVLEWKLLRWVGTLSYSIYLWQMIFLPELASEMAEGRFRYLQRAPWNVVAILVCACISRYCIEIPITRLGHRLGASRVAPATPIGTVAAMR
jgi:peptidoglycan/LPS O-acetylase OafA/YrhL